MDFGAVLHKAQKNEVCKKEAPRYYSTKFEAPKKEKRTKELSVNVRKFLQKKEAEEKVKMLEAQKKKDELLALRAKDKKATRRVNVMLKRTKSANMSVIEDAVDTNNTSVTLAGPSQCDEDDYGYVSQEASAYYNKLMEKYSNMPDEPKFNLDKKKKVSGNLTSTKERVKAALEREKEEANMPRSRKRKHTESTEKTLLEEDRSSPEPESPPQQAPPPKPKPRPPPPAMNFNELLKLAAKKQFEPIVIEQKPKEEERLFTKKQKKEYEREREWRERREGKLPPLQPPSPPSAAAQRDAGKGGPSPNKIPKLKSSEAQKPMSNSVRPAEAPRKPSSMVPSKSSTGSSSAATASSSSPSLSSNMRPNGGKSAEVPKRPPPQQALSKAGGSSSGVRPNGGSRDSVTPNANRPRADDLKKPSLLKKAIVEGSKSLTSSSRYNESLKGKEREARPQEREAKREAPPMRPPAKQFPPSDLRPPKHASQPQPQQRPKQFPPPDVRRPGGEFPPKNVKRKPLISKGRFLDDDDEDEYDSEMDDFIDDGPDDGCDDLANTIRQVFGYDKSRYREIDEDDVDNMESSFAQQMREEVVSTKIGIMEDLEDIKMEEEHKRRKMQMKKKMKSK